MNPADIFKASLGTAASALSPVGTSLFQLGSSLFGNNANSTPSTNKSQFLSTLTPSTGTPAPSASVPSPTTTAGGNPAATAPLTPKQNYVNSQVGGNTGTGTPGQLTGDKSSGNPYASIGSPSGTPGLDAYTTAFNKYLASLQPDKDEQDTASALANYKLQDEQDQDYAYNKPGQTLGFAAGETARVARNNSFAIDALSNKLNAQTGARTASTNATKAQLDFEKGLYDDAKADAKPDYTTVSPGATLFDPKTGKPVYTAPTTASQNPGPLGGGYIAGTDPIADGWVTAINNNQAKLTDVPAAYKSIVAQGLAAAGKDDALKGNALTSAQQLLDQFDNSSGFLGIGSAKSAVGTSSFLPVIPGTQSADFVANMDNLKSLLSLDNVKYLKGQGAVSDAERKLLADSATQLSRSQSEPQFKATLQKIIDGLNKFGQLQGADTSGGDEGDADYQAYLKAIGQ